MHSKGDLQRQPKSKTIKGELYMQKKEKLVAIIVTTIVSLLVSIIACIFGIDADKILPAHDAEFATQSTVCCAAAITDN